MSRVFCPICHRKIDWQATPPHRVGPDGRPEIVTREPGESDPSWQDRLLISYRPCGPIDKPGTHLLPYDYGDYTPITIGMVGQSKAGKTHLLAAMMSRICSNDPALERLGLRVEPLDLAVHQKYLNTCVTPLIVHRRRLPDTPANARVEFCDALKITNSARQSFALTFFDLAGERLARPNDDEVRFYTSADALMFVVDPETLPKRSTPGPDGDASFDVALRRLERRRPWLGAPFLPVAAAVVIAKADLIRFSDDVVCQWLRVGSAEEELALETIQSESEDVYAYLTRRGATRWLRPAQECYRSTLHFASATNGPAGTDGMFRGPFRQCRVLRPLLSVFAMTGVLDAHVLRQHHRRGA